MDNFLFVRKSSSYLGASFQMATITIAVSDSNSDTASSLHIIFGVLQSLDYFLPM